MADELDEKEVVEEVIETPEGDEPESPSKEETVDYEALAKEERERREVAEALLIKNKRIAKRNEDVEEDEPENEEDKPITRADLADILRTERNATHKELKEAQALEIARANTSSEAAAQAALLFWKNRVIPTDNLEDDIKFAIGGLNQKKIVSKNAELARALKSKDGVLKDSASVHKDALPSPSKLSADSPLVGFIHMGNGLYSKKLASGKTMYKNTKAQGNERKSWFE